MNFLTVEIIKSCIHDEQKEMLFMDLKWIVANELDFTTNENEAIFCCGTNRTPVVHWAKSNGKTTLEMTAGGRYLEKLDLFNLRGTYRLFFDFCKNHFFSMQ